MSSENNSSDETLEMLLQGGYTLAELNAIAVTRRQAFRANLADVELAAKCLDAQDAVKAKEKQIFKVGEIE